MKPLPVVMQQIEKVSKDLAKEISRQHIKSSNWFLSTLCDKMLMERNEIKQENVESQAEFRGNINKAGLVVSKTKLFPKSSISGW